MSTVAEKVALRSTEAYPAVAPMMKAAVATVHAGPQPSAMIRPVAETHFDHDAHAANEDRISTRQEATR